MSNEIQYKCPKCDDIFDKELDYNAHLLWKHGTYRAICSNMQDVKRAEIIEDMKSSMQKLYIHDELALSVIIKQLQEWNVKDIPSVYSIEKYDCKCGMPRQKRLYHTPDEIMHHSEWYRISENTKEKILNGFGVKEKLDKNWKSKQDMMVEEENKDVYKEKLFMPDGSVNQNLNGTDIEFRKQLGDEEYMNKLLDLHMCSYPNCTKHASRVTKDRLCVSHRSWWACRWIDYRRAVCSKCRRTCYPTDLPLVTIEQLMKQPNIR